jgi:hypothetical protein|tara:strand:- start:93 stop:434 length:342 start_codon:yes stop_codon:yes gene_type:complete
MTQDKAFVTAFNGLCDDAQCFTEKTLAAVVVVDIDHNRAEPGWIEYWLTTLLIPFLSGSFHKSNGLNMVEVSEFVGVFVFYGDEGFSFYRSVSGPEQPRIDRMRDVPDEMRTI